jgi:hypothetical protein
MLTPPQPACSLHTTLGISPFCGIYLRHRRYYAARRLASLLLAISAFHFRI